jgi:hypothetical protein
MTIILLGKKIISTFPVQKNLTSPFLPNPLKNVGSSDIFILDPCFRGLMNVLESAILPFLYERDQRLPGISNEERLASFTDQFNNSMATGFPRRIWKANSKIFYKTKEKLMVRRELKKSLRQVKEENERISLRIVQKYKRY